MTNLLTSDDRREAYHNLLSQGHKWDYAQWLHELTFRSLENIESLFGAELSSVPLRNLVEPIAVINVPRAESWRDAMDDVSAFFDVLPVSGSFGDALLYGYFGVTSVDIALENRVAWLHDLVADVSAFTERSDVIHLNGGDNALLRISRLASSRLAIDFGEGEVDIASLSILGSVSEGRIRNILSETDGPLERGVLGGVKGLSAAAWLQKKKTFLASIWQDDKERNTEVVDDMPISADAVYFVPVARDGSMFTPDLSRDGSYQIGARGAEEKISDYEEALSRLNSMAVPRWRRPNENNLWGIVSGVTWQRIEKK